MEKVEKFISKKVPEKVPKMEKPKEIGERGRVANNKPEMPKKVEPAEGKKAFRAEEELKQEQIRKELEKKFQEIEKRKRIETIEKLLFNPRSKMELLLTFLGEKPANFLDLEAHLSNLPAEQRKVINTELSQQAEKALKYLKLFYEIKKSKSGEFSYIFISKTKEKLTDLSKAFKKEDWGKVGLALGYPESAVKAYVEHFEERGRKPLKSLIEEILSSLPEEEKKQTIEEGSHKFFSFGPSLEGWGEEVKLAKKYQEIVKKEPPAIYKEIMEEN